MLDPISGEAIHDSRSWNIIWDLQGTHGTAIDQQHYAINVGTTVTDGNNQQLPGHRHQLWSMAVYDSGEAGSGNIEGIVRQGQGSGAGY